MAVSWWIVAFLSNDYFHVGPASRLAHTSVNPFVPAWLKLVSLYFDVWTYICARASSI